MSSFRCESGLRVPLVAKICGGRHARIGGTIECAPWRESDAGAVVVTFAQAAASAASGWSGEATLDVATAVSERTVAKRADNWTLVEWSRIVRTEGPPRATWPRGARGAFHRGGERATYTNLVKL